MTTLTLAQPFANPVGKQVQYLVESDGPLTREDAWAALQEGQFVPGQSKVVAFGIGAPPVWLHLRVENPRDTPLSRVLSVETAWLDEVVFYFRHDGQWVGKYALGDRRVYAARLRESTGFSIEHTFASGTTDVLLRVATPDPLVVPLYLESESALIERQQAQSLSYGFLYGFLIALVVYNLMLFAGLRQGRYLLYAIYLSFFLLMNFSYTGQAYAWLWPESPFWAQWSQPVLMMLYASSGLVFALSFLETRMHFPRLHRLVLGYIGLGGLVLGVLMLADRQANALLLAFSFVIAFAVIMLVLGIVSVRAGLVAARYFLLAAVAAMVGAALTALSVWGVIPFTLWTYRAVDVGMLLDATLLALALTYQFRLGQTQRDQAEQLARLDPLTGVNNRRAFYALSAPVWSRAVEAGRPLAVILIDIDRFKLINDEFGHAAGDAALQAVAGRVGHMVRKEDVVARWGGEEFIVLLPDTAGDEAYDLAERLRARLADAPVTVNGHQISVTASFGVAARHADESNLETLIGRADRRLYRAKDEGRNRTVAWPSIESVESDQWPSGIHKCPDGQVAD
ncbi:sensor domain-containing diguanylate cyclase [Guyparkeria sp. 1SP6A2]|nr:sensor domain-containing diguanylate cyclase [Guyparkeria sp. 1SP6A2]